MKCKTILPQNLDEVINKLDLVGCEKLNNIKKAIKKIENFNNALKIDEEFLEALIDEVEGGAFREFEEDKRKLIYFAKQNYPKLGTIKAIKEIFKALNIEAKVIEWFESNKEPYTFDLELSLTDKKITPELIKKLKKLVEFSKNVRSKLDELILGYLQKQNIFIGSGAVGEVAINTEMLKGYESGSIYIQSINMGGVGEVSSYAVMEG